MGTEFVDKLNAWKRQKNTVPNTPKYTHVIAFHKVKNEVQEGLNAGFLAKDIWGYLTEQGKIKSQYRTFMKHIHIYLELDEKDGEEANDKKQFNAREVKSDPQTSPKHEPKTTKTTLPKYEFNSTPNREDLI